MKVLYVINTGLVGGLQAHVKCLMQSLEGVAETAVAINTEIDPKVIPMFEDVGLKVYRLRGRSGHDWRVVGRFKRVLEDFKPDVIHAHGLPFFCAVWLWFHNRKKTKSSFCRDCGGLRISRPTGWGYAILHSLHTPPRKPRGKGLLEWFVLDRLVDYWLPVSTSTWTEFKKWHPKAKGEVFFNPIRIGIRDRGSGIRESNNPTIKQSNNFIVGMVGRNADQKDWPSFHKVESIIQARLSQLSANHPLYAYASNLRLSFLNAGEKEVCDGRAAIARMDLFVMTSKHEQLPTTVLECFLFGTPICGFLPVGGTSDILGFSKGPVREAFITERNCDKLADIVMDLLAHPEKRRALVEDGRQILENHFDAEKNCRSRLIEIYQQAETGAL